MNFPRRAPFLRRTRETRSSTRSTSRSRRGSALSKTSNDRSSSSSRTGNTTNSNSRRLTKRESSKQSSSTSNRLNSFSNNTKDSRSSYRPSSNPRTRTRASRRSRSLNPLLEAQGSQRPRRCCLWPLRSTGLTKTSLIGVPVTFIGSTIPVESVIQAANEMALEAGLLLDCLQREGTFHIWDDDFPPLRINRSCEDHIVCSYGDDLIVPDSTSPLK